MSCVVRGRNHHDSSMVVRQKILPTKKLVQNRNSLISQSQPTNSLLMRSTIGITIHQSHQCKNTLADLSSLVSSKNVAPIAPRTPFSSGPRLRGGGNARDCPRDQADAHPEGFGAAWLLTNDGGCATMTNEVRHAKAQERKRQPSPSLGSCLHLGVAIPRLPKSLG